MVNRFIDTRDVVSHFVPLYAKGKTLDVGGGSSKYREIITKTVSDYLVSDLYGELGVDVVTDARKMSFPDASFDTIVSFQVLEHIDDTTAAVREMYRVLKRGGCVIATAPFLGAEHGHPSDYHRFTIEGIQWHFEHVGFTTVACGKQGSTFSVIAELVRFVVLNPYKKHGRVRRGIVDRILQLLKIFDRKGFLQNADLYAGVHIVAQKK